MYAKEQMLEARHIDDALKLSARQFNTCCTLVLTSSKNTLTTKLRQLLLQKSSIVSERVSVSVLPLVLQ